MFYTALTLILHLFIFLQRTQKYLCELYREGSYHPRHLQLHEVPKSPSPTSYTMPHKTKLIPLEEVFKIVASKVLVKGKHLFQIMTSKQNYSFGTDTSDEAEKWIKTLNEELFGLPKAGVTCTYVAKRTDKHYILLCVKYCTSINYIVKSHLVATSESVVRPPHCSGQIQQVQTYFPLCNMYLILP